MSCQTLLSPKPSTTEVGSNAASWWIEGLHFFALADSDITARYFHLIRVLRVFARLGLGSPGGSCVWHVVGLQRSLRQWALRQGWGGRPVRVEQAQGILVAALGMQAGYYGYGKR